jgi:hypothetical protein
MKPSDPSAPVESDDLSEVWLRFLLQLDPDTPVFSKPDALREEAARDRPERS